MKIKKVCTYCGSTDILVDSWVVWNECTQEFDIENIFDYAYCNECQGETKILDKELDL